MIHYCTTQYETRKVFVDAAENRHFEVATEPRFLPSFAKIADSDVNGRLAKTKAGARSTERPPSSASGHHRLRSNLRNHILTAMVNT